MLSLDILREMFAYSPSETVMICAITVVCSIAAGFLTTLTMYADVWSRTPVPEPDVLVCDDDYEEVYDDGM